jgi:signal transduction histidine kinase
VIEDNGRGMSEEVMQHIFEPFFTTKDVGSGTGLGLSISYSIIEKHKGKIMVKSKEGKGTAFTIVLWKSMEHAVDEDSLVLNK